MAEGGGRIRTRIDAGFEFGFGLGVSMEGNRKVR